MEAQGRKWDPLLTVENPFVSIRGLWLPEDTGSIVWNVLHIAGVPYDNCGYTELTKSIANANRILDVIKTT